MKPLKVGGVRLYIVCSTRQSRAVNDAGVPSDQQSTATVTPLAIYSTRDSLPF